MSAALAAGLTLGCQAQKSTGPRRSHEEISKKSRSVACGDGSMLQPAADTDRKPPKKAAWENGRYDLEINLSVVRDGLFVSRSVLGGIVELKSIQCTGFTCEVFAEFEGAGRLSNKAPDIDPLDFVVEAVSNPPCMYSGASEQAARWRSRIGWPIADQGEYIAQRRGSGQWSVHATSFPDDPGVGRTLAARWGVKTNHVDHVDQSIGWIVDDHGVIEQMTWDVGFVEGPPPVPQDNGLGSYVSVSGRLQVHADSE